MFSQYKKRYLEMYGNNSAPGSLRQTGKSAICKVGVFIRELSDDEDETSIELDTSPIDLHSPWYKDFNGYLNSKDQLGNMTIIEWWGVCIVHFMFEQRFHKVLVECDLVCCLGIPRSRYTPNYGVFCLERTCVLICRDHHY